MSIEEFVTRQNEFIGKVAEFDIDWKDGDKTTIARKLSIPNEYHVPNHHSFVVTQVRIKEK